ncbi:hypothetical protein HanPI659440_Chr00c01g0705231 [Helianthus annuus]|nr:hypothetical protein HanPI659440_Chr00c01g0705231 [Helianthus annuus]
MTVVPVQDVYIVRRFVSSMQSRATGTRLNNQLAKLYAGETHLKNIYEKIKKDRLNNAREVHGAILVVRALWFKSKLEVAVKSFGGGAQVVLLGADLINQINKVIMVPFIRFSDVKLSPIGDLEANYGLFHDPYNLFKKVHGLPRLI